MKKPRPEKQAVVEAIRATARSLGHVPSRREFLAGTHHITLNRVYAYFSTWGEAVEAAGLDPYTANIRLDDNLLLQDWGRIVRERRHIPTRNQYRLEGTYSPHVFEGHFGSWSRIPDRFREFANDRQEWADVLALLPPTTLLATVSVGHGNDILDVAPPAKRPPRKNAKLTDSPTYGNPIDFRGLRHEPVNEQGVVFLFGIVARELGYLVEAVQTGFPDCEAKRQVEGGRWQRVRIEFEFESRNYDHPTEGCDVIVCWRHTWPDCPAHIEVIELSKVITSLPKSED